MKSVPQFILNFILPSTQAATVREYVAEHFHAVDLLRSPAAPFSHPMTLRLEKTQEPIYAPAASGRLVLLNPVTHTTCLYLRTRTLSVKKMPTVCDWLPPNFCGMYRMPRAR